MATKTSKFKERQCIIECIHLYRDSPSLWNVKCKEYHDRFKKNAAYETLLSKYREMCPDATKDDVKKKFNSLRTNYRKELRKHMESMKHASSADDIYQPTSWYYNEMFFLQEQETSVEALSNTNDIRCAGEESVTLSSDCNCKLDSTSDGDADTQTPSTSNTDPGRKEKKMKRKYDDELTNLHAKSIRIKSDEYENWALSCAADLKKMSPVQQILAKHAISTILMEGQLGLLRHHSVINNIPLEKNKTYNTNGQPSPLILSEVDIDSLVKTEQQEDI